MKALDFTTIIPGHGEVVPGKERVTQFQGYLRDVWDQVAKLRRDGIAPADAAKRIDLTAHRGAFQNITGPGADPAGVARQYRVMAEREQQ